MFTIYKCTQSCGGVLHSFIVRGLDLVSVLVSCTVRTCPMYTFFPLGKICFQNSSSRHDVTQRQHCGLAKYVFKKRGGVGHDIIKSPCKDIIYIQIYKLLAMTIRVLTRCVEANRLRLVITEPIHGNRVRIIGIIITLHFIHKK